MSLRSSLRSFMPVRVTNTSAPPTNYETHLHCIWLGDGEGAGGIRNDDNDDRPVAMVIK